MSEKNAYEKMQELIKQHPGNIAVLEEEIDVVLQMKYFKESKAIKKDLDKELVLKRKNRIFRNDVDIEEKRTCLLQLASIDNVEAYRAIEKYMEEPDELLAEWVKLAFQESKMSLESSLLDDAPLFISTGLGGRGQKLRYFIVVTSKGHVPLSGDQEKIVKSEFEFHFKSSEAEIEEVIAYGYAIAVVGLIPLEISLKDFITEVIDKCNELGSFLSNGFMITNVKKLSFDEIEKAIEGYEKQAAQQSEHKPNDDELL